MARRRSEPFEIRIAIPRERPGGGPRVTCVRVRRGVVVLDYRDSSGRRRVPSFGPEKEDESWEKARRARARLRYLGDEDTEMLYEDAWAMWLEETRETVDEATHARYEEAGRLYLAPTFTGVRVVKIRRRAVKALVLEALAQKRKDGRPRFARSTVRKRILGVLANFLQWCLDEEIILHNPARELGRRLFRKKKSESDRPKAMTEDQMTRWTVATETLTDGRTFLGLMLMLDGGLRIGEVLGLRVEDFDLAGNLIHIRRQVRCPLRGAIVTTPKTRAGVRTIEMSERIKTHLQAELRIRGEEALGQGRPACQWIAWDFTADPTRQEADLARGHYQRTMRKLCEAAGIGRFTPHGLRHTWGTIQADHGAGAKALQAWYGHSTLAQTDEYVSAARPRLGGHLEEPAGVDLMEKIADKRRPRVASFKSAPATSRARRG
jgi:integrase